MPKLIDITGLTTGRLTVIERSHQNNKGEWLWLCNCSCGGTTTLRGSRIKSGKTKSCGCYKRDHWKDRPPHYEGLTGKVFNRLTVLEFSHKNNHRQIYWHCRCECGDTSVVRSDSLRDGSVKSCGCLQKEATARIGHDNATHGMTGSPTYITWGCMKFRCYNLKASDYARYGGRGIRVCDRWKDSFESFFADMGDKPTASHSIDRIDNEGDYTPENCRWATRIEQANNKRNSQFITYNGETLTLTQWSRRTGLSCHALKHRLDKWDNLHDVFTKPVRGY